MTRATRALLGREFGRLAAGRVVLFGGLAALLMLGLGSATVVIELYSSSGDPAHRAALLRAAGFEASENYGTLLLLLAAILGANQTAADARGGAIFGILARPVSRARLFLTSWTASATVLLMLQAIPLMVLFATAAVLERRVDPVALLAAVGVVMELLLVLAMFAAYGALLDAGWAALSGFATLIVSSLAYRKVLGETSQRIVDAVGLILPLMPGQSDLIRDAMQGGGTPTGPIMETVAYRVCWIAMWLVLGVYGFQRRDLTPRA